MGLLSRFQKQPVVKKGKPPVIIIKEEEDSEEPIENAISVVVVKEEPTEKATDSNVQNLAGMFDEEEDDVNMLLND